MTTPLTYEQAMLRLPQILVDCLSVDLEDVTPEAEFVGDLGGESIDLLDLNFRCEKAFDIKSPFQLFTGSRDQLTLDCDGFLTEQSIRFIDENYSFFAENLSADGSSRWKPQDLLGHFTVEMIARFVLHAAAEQAANSHAA